ncbi:MAG TPA: tetratricopeptide repeat protein [Longimicrobium sp.]|nr:tetratricopeptide repeat protein [Longimicrobium sp.]
MSGAPGGPDALADEVRALAQRREWPGVAELAGALPEGALLADVEVAFHYADALWHLGDVPRALDVAERIEPRVRHGGGRRLLLHLLNVIGICLFRQGRGDGARRRWAELLERAARWDDVEFVGRSCNNLGMLANLGGRHDEALGLYGRAVAAYSRIGFVHGLAQTHHNLALSYRDLGFPERADAHLRRAIRLARRAGLDDVVGLAESERAMLLVKAGEAALAEVLAGQAAERFERARDPLGRAEALRVRAAAARADARPAEAAAWLDEALSAADADADPFLRAEVQRDRGVLLRDQGRPAEARAALCEGVDLFERVGAVHELEAARSLLAGLDATT